MEEVVEAVADKINASNIRSVEYSIANPPSIETLKAKLVLAQAEQYAAMAKFNATNPSEKKRVNPPRYVSWPNHCVKYAQKEIDERDAKIAGERKILARYEWLQRNSVFVDKQIANLQIIFPPVDGEALD